MQKHFSENYLQFGHEPPKFRHDRPKSLKNVSFKVGQMISVPGAPTCLGSAVPVGQVNTATQQH